MKDHGIRVERQPARHHHLCSQVAGAATKAVSLACRWRWLWFCYQIGERHGEASTICWQPRWILELLSRQVESTFGLRSVHKSPDASSCVMYANDHAFQMTAASLARPL